MPELACPCRSAASPGEDHHGTGPDGFVPARWSPDCALCGGSGVTTRGRVAARRTASGLVLVGAASALLAVPAWFAARTLGVGLAGWAVATGTAGWSLGRYLAWSSRARGS